MGRVKNTAVRSLGKELIKEHGTKFTEDFDKNKTALDSVKKIKSKKIRNVVAGYITIKVKQNKKSPLA